MAHDDTAALFVRLPRAAAQKLDRASAEAGTPKRELVTRLVDRFLDPSAPDAMGSGVPLRFAPGDDLVLGRASFQPSENVVLTPPQAAELLQVEEEIVLSLAAAGEIPGRSLDGAWRFSRDALLDWLAAR
jgi:excisionase family DNA binding protein